jgi:hypothetical protein
MPPWYTQATLCWHQEILVHGKPLCIMCGQFHIGTLLVLENLQLLLSTQLLPLRRYMMQLQSKLQGKRNHQKPLKEVS